jgi:hypothetical protein
MGVTKLITDPRKVSRFFGIQFCYIIHQCTDITQNKNNLFKVKNSTTSTPSVSSECINYCNKLISNNNKDKCFIVTGHFNSKQ